MSEDRIEQFRKMAEADPDNELGHFSLGKALLEADHPEGAIPPLQRVLEINGGFSKAYQLLGEAQVKTGQQQEAIETLQTGFRIAIERGDRMPADAMRDQLEQLGAEVPTVESPTPVAPATSTPTEAPPGADAFRCARCGSTEKMPERPFKGKLGERVWANTCVNCWREWIGMGTKVINELGLVLASPEGQEAYDMHMIEFLNLPPE